MIHVLTVHWRIDFWVDVQISHLRKYIREPFRILAFCDGTRSDHSAKFDYCSLVKGVVDHATKLNMLADRACEEGSDDDVLIFCDSDAFPVRDITEYIPAQLAKWPLVAVQRLENAGDIQPHPCFSITTIGFWRRIRGDWRAGPTWKNSFGQVVTDVGANVLRSLTLQGLEWRKLHRSNRVNLHPLFFAVYDGTVYHHGAGSRPSVGGRALKHVELSHLDPEEAKRRARQIRQETSDVNGRVLDIISRGQDDDLLAILC